MGMICKVELMELRKKAKVLRLLRACIDNSEYAQANEAGIITVLGISQYNLDFLKSRDSFPMFEVVSVTSAMMGDKLRVELKIV